MKVLAHGVCPPQPPTRCWVVHCTVKGCRHFVRTHREHTAVAAIAEHLAYTHNPDQPRAAE